jgi:hypothetical protein
MQSDIRLASFDDHYLYDSLTIPVDTGSEGQWNENVR